LTLATGDLENLLNTRTHRASKPISHGRRKTQTNTTEGNKKKNKKTNKHEYSIFKEQFEICQKVY